MGLGNAENRLTWVKNTLAKIPQGSRILDAGAGERKYEKYCSHLTYVAQDFAQYDGKGDGSGLQSGTWHQTRLDIVSDITSIPEPDESFDAILCLEVFEHIPDPGKAIAEFARLTKPRGHLILTAPFCSLTHQAPHHYYSGFNRYFYRSLLTEAGYEIEDLQENGNFFHYLGQEVRRIPEVARKYCDIRATLFDRLIIRLMLRSLDKFVDIDKGSNELLCFGYHVYARKSG